MTEEIILTDVDTLVGRISGNLTDLASIAYKDYQGMREFQGKFMKADHELRELRELLKNGISTADQLPEDRELVILWGPHCNDQGKPFPGRLWKSFMKYYDTSEFCEGYSPSDIERWWPIPEAPYSK